MKSHLQYLRVGARNMEKYILPKKRSITDSKIIRHNLIKTPYKDEIGLNENVDLTGEEIFRTHRNKGFYVGEEEYRF